MALATGPRPRAQGWARTLYEASPQIQGLLYPSSMDANGPALALFERARAAIPSHPSFHRALAEPPLLVPVTSTSVQLGYRIV